MVTVDLKVFNDTSSSNGDYYFDLTVKNKTTNGIVAGQQGQTSINQEITFEYEYDKDKRPNYNLTQNQEIAIEYSLFDEDVQSAPNPINNPTELNCTAPSLFTGFSAQYKATVSGECVEITYDKYYGYRGDSGYNLFLRENPSTGTIKQIDYTTYRYASDSQFKPATNYIYYVTKSNVLENGEMVGIIPDYFAHLMEMAGLPYSVMIAENRAQYYEWVTNNAADLYMDISEERSTFLDENSGLCTDSYIQLTLSRVTKRIFRAKFIP